MKLLYGVLVTILFATSVNADNLFRSDDDRQLQFLWCTPGAPYPGWPGWFYNDWCYPIWSPTCTPGEPYPDMLDYVYDDNCLPLRLSTCIPGEPVPGMPGFIYDNNCNPFRCTLGAPYPDTPGYVYDDSCLPVECSQGKAVPGMYGFIYDNNCYPVILQGNVCPCLIPVSKKELWDDTMELDLVPTADSCVVQADGSTTSLRMQLGGNPLQPSSTSELYLEVLNQGGFLWRRCRFDNGWLQTISASDFDTCFETIEDACDSKGTPIDVARSFNICEKDTNGYTLNTVVGADALEEPFETGALFPGDDVPNLPDLRVNDACDLEGDIMTNCPCVMGNEAEFFDFLTSIEPIIPSSCEQDLLDREFVRLVVASSVPSNKAPRFLVDRDPTSACRFNDITVTSGLQTITSAQLLECRDVLQGVCALKGKPLA